MKINLTILTLLLVFSWNLTAQETTDSTLMWQLSTRDGNEFIGFIIEQDNNNITLKTLSYGEIIVPISLISEKKQLSFSQTQRQSKKTHAQNIQVSDTNNFWRIVTNEGYDFVGQIVSQSATQVELKTELYGTLNLKRHNITNITQIQADKIIQGQAWAENPQGTRYFYSPNGYGLKKREGYYQNVWVLFNQASLGFSDYFSLGIGLVPTFFFGTDIFPVWLTPKFSFPIVKDKFNMGAGAFMGFIYGDNSVFGIPYGVATYGSRDKNVTLGFGYLYADGDWAKYPTVSLSTMIRTGKKGYFISENYYLGGMDSGIWIISAGGRTVWPRLSLDFGLALPLSSEFDQTVAIPWLGFVIPFGDKL